MPSIRDSFLYIETSSSDHGNNVFVSWQRIDIIQITDITFYYKRFSNLTNISSKSVDRFRFQLLLAGNTWSTRYNIHKKDGCTDLSTDLTPVSLNFAVEIYGIKLTYDQIDTAHADMCCSIFTITHSVY